MTNRINLDNNRITLINGDCLEILPKVKPNCIDMLFADLPYGTTQNKWDSVIPLDQLWPKLLNCGKVNTPYIFTATMPFTALLVTSNLTMFKYDWVFEKLGKSNGHLNAKKQPLRNKEDIVVFYRDQCCYIPQMTRGAPYKNKAGKDYTKTSSMTNSYGNYTNFRYDNEGQRYPKQIISFPRVERNTVHPTQKPVELLEYLIKTYTNANDVILDPTMGSGTTGVACINLNRRFIGIELDQGYFDIAVKRCEEALNAKQ